MTSEEFVRGLAVALPEAFAGQDIAEEYDHSEFMTAGERAADPDDDGWTRTIALADARHWVEQHALIVDRAAQRTTVRPGGEDALRRFFGYVEPVVAACRGREDKGWIMVELFEGTPWTEDVLEYLGPRTVELLRLAQVELAPFNSRIGRWAER